MTSRINIICLKVGHFKKMPPTPQYVSYTKYTAFELSDLGEKEIAFNHISVVLVHYNLEFSCIV